METDLGNYYQHYISQMIMTDDMFAPLHTERAYQIIRVLVQEKIIPEPKSYQKFRDLIEAIKKII